MLENIFSNNIFVGFIITIFVITSYSHFEENQQVSMIYLVIFGLAMFKKIPVRMSAVFLITAMFLYLEYLTKDKKKTELIYSFRYKTLDYLYLMFFQYNVFGMAVSLLLLFLSHICARPFDSLFLIFSGLTFIYSEHRVISQPFKTGGITEMFAPFAENPYYKFRHSGEARKRYKMLCSFEDRTYFDREKSYSSFSLEFIKVYGGKKALKKIGEKLFEREENAEPKTGKIRKTFRWIKTFFRRLKRLLGRGYSTPEMQLIRTIGVEKGYDKYKIRRKVFEILYAKILLGSLKQYNKENSALEVTHFRDYILDVYLKNVITIINGERFAKFSNAFDEPGDVSLWPPEGMFIACLGLNFRSVTEENILLYADVIEEFDLDEEKIREYGEMIKEGKKIPCGEKSQKGAE